MFFKTYDWIYRLKLPINEHKLLPIIVTFTEYKGQAHLSYSMIEELAYINRGSIKKTIDNLIEWGLIEKMGSSIYKALYLENSPENFELQRKKNDNITSSKTCTSSKVCTSSNIHTRSSSKTCTSNSSNIHTEIGSNIHTEIDIDICKDISIEKEKENNGKTETETFLPLGEKVPDWYYQDGMKKRPYPFVKQEDWDKWNSDDKGSLIRGEYGDIEEKYKWINKEFYKN